jgi:hypothetical protein
VKSFIFSILALILVAACNSDEKGHSAGRGGPLAECDVGETEPNDVAVEADFAGTLLPGDFITVCGRENSNGNSDWWWFFTPASQTVSFVVETPAKPTVTMEAWIYTNTVQDPDTFLLQGHFVGVPGRLIVLDWPVGVADNGFFLVLRGHGAPAMYSCETWSESWL